MNDRVEAELQIVEVEPSGMLHTAVRMPQYFGNELEWRHIGHTKCGKRVRNGTSVPLTAWGKSVDEFSWCATCGRAVPEEIERQTREQMRLRSERLRRAGVIVEDAA